MPNLKLVTYCGLYCGLCAQHNRIPQRARTLKESMEKEGYTYWGGEIPGFKEFWKFLEGLCEINDENNCRNGNCGNPSCSIRKCAQEREIDICSSCDEYPCNRILGIAKGYPTLLTDGKRMKEIGIEKWVEEQEERRKTGFAYVDIRCYPYEVPDE
ncbi:MAG: DUF3795 domain-containing protein [Candidatus Hatepunaea meridiana]|nr:DUF3795 domain-containing protein [Candidatus Hatepunaea meridiana]